MLYLPIPCLYDTSYRFFEQLILLQMKMQESACVDLLRAEINYFNPTHIFVVAGTSWFAPFKDLFINKTFRMPNIASGPNKNKIYVEGTAEYITPSGTVCNVIIVCRPECRTKADYITQVNNFFSKEVVITKDEQI